MKLLQVASAATLSLALAALAFFADAPAAHATDANTCGYVQGPGGWYKSADRSGPYAIDGSCTATLLGAAGGGGGGAVTQSTSPWVDNVSQFGGSNVVTGTGVGGAGVPRMTISTDSSLSLTGTLPAFAATPTFNIGTAPSLAVTGTFWQATQPVSAASLPLPTGAATSANQATAAAIGSTTSGQTGPLVQGAVTTAAPSYTTGQTNPLSLNTAGGLRVDGSGVTQPVSAANPATIYSGQQTCTASAVALPSQALVNGVSVKALKTNTGTAYLGPSGVSTATGYPLTAGEAIPYAVTNLNAVFLICTGTTDIVAFTGN